MSGSVGYEERLDLVESLLDGDLTVADAWEYKDKAFIERTVGWAYDLGLVDDDEEVLYLYRPTVEPYGVNALQEMDDDIPEELDPLAPAQTAYDAAEHTFTAPQRAMRSVGERVFAADSRVGAATIKAADRLERPLGLASAIGPLVGGVGGIMQMPTVLLGGVGMFASLQGSIQVLNGLSEGAAANHRHALQEQMVEDIGSYRVEAVRRPGQDTQLSPERLGIEEAD